MRGELNWRRVVNTYVFQLIRNDIVLEAQQITQSPANKTLRLFNNGVLSLNT